MRAYTASEMRPRGAELPGIIKKKMQEEKTMFTMVHLGILLAVSFTGSVSAMLVRGLKAEK